MRPALHARLRARLQNRLQNREPDPPLPSVPLLSPVITPIVDGNPHQPPQAASHSSPQPAPQPAPLSPPLPQPVPAPPPPSQQAPPPPSPQQIPASDPHGGGNGGGGGPPPNAGGSSGDHGNGKGPHSNNGNDGSGTPPSGSVGSGNSNPDSQPQGQPSSDSPSGSALPPSPSEAAAGSTSDGSLHLGSSTAAGVAPTGAVVAFPLNNEAAATSLSGSAPSNIVQGAVGTSSGVIQASTPSITPGSTLGSPDSSHGSLGDPSASNGDNGDGSGSGSTGANNSLSSGSHSQLSSGAIGGIIAVVVILCSIVIFYVVRKRYLRRKAEEQVQWINGYISEDAPDMQEAQRCTSMRSSWGTPIEHRFSDPFQLRPDAAPNTQEGTYIVESPYIYSYGDAAPVLPMPVHSPVENRLYSPENPFADGNSSPQPIKRMSSLPIRISLISEGSGHPDPFDDAQGYVVDDHISQSGISSATFGQGSGINRDPAHGTQANFPMPPPSASSASTIFAIGTPSQLLEPPGILISFFDSPVSPTFAPEGTSSYPRRVSVKLPYRPSHDRRDEVLLEKGDQVNVVSVYEDGWAFIQNEKNSERGLVPLNCLDIDNP